MLSVLGITISSVKPKKLSKTLMEMIDMTRNELRLVMDKSESRQQVINLAFQYLYGCCLKAIEQDDNDIMRGMVEGALENVEQDLKF